ncbi:hypothetical protein AQUCO_08300056v1, partial [Aquilegia coerulea]
MGALNNNMSGIISTLLPPILMVLVQTSFAGTNLLYKVAIEDGMDINIAVAYRFLLASGLLMILAFYKERTHMSNLTWNIVFKGFLCGLFGGTLFQLFYSASLNYTSTTIATAMGNLEPAFTFVLAIIFRMESVAIGSTGGKAKIVGTLLSVGGAMLLTFYKGIEIKTGSLHVVKLHGDDIHSKPVHHHILGSLLAFASSIFYSGYLIVQARMSEQYPFHYTNAAMMCATTSIQTGFYALIRDRDWTHWKLGFNIRLLTVLFSGIFASGLSSTLISWCVQYKDPLYVAIFSPLMLLLVALGGTFLLNEKLYLGSILGGLMTVMGLYVVLWGKSKETKTSKNSGDDAVQME